MNRNKFFPNEPPRHVVQKVVFTLPNGIEREEFIDSDIDPWAWEKFMTEYYKTIMSNLDCESDKILSEKKND